MQRIDTLITQRAMADTRTQAQRIIKEGRVQVKEPGKHWTAVSKPGLKVADDSELQITSSESDRYVSRGAWKLVEALRVFNIDVTDMTAIDIGQSTGGFTDCLLQAGTGKVVGIEVGHDQLSPALRSNARVICLEGMNARSLPDELRAHTPDQRGFDLAVMDVSFISQTKILPSLVPLIRSNGQLISLVKPQFEVGKEGLGKGGIVKDHALFHQVETKIKSLCTDLNLEVRGYIPSPIKGGDGNHEFLLWAVKNA